MSAASKMVPERIGSACTLSFLPAIAGSNGADRHAQRQHARGVEGSRRMGHECEYAQTRHAECHARPDDDCPCIYLHAES